MIHDTIDVNVHRLRLTVHGTVQGVGFRPFVFRIANALGLAGWVENTPQGVTIEVEGSEEKLTEFRHRLESDKPLPATILSSESSILDARGLTGFEIRKSLCDGVRTTLILPDMATCSACLQDIFDPNNRRYRYPFTNCTNCGPRFSIIESLPYDRPNTSMKRFTMCVACRTEYEDPVDRRFHAQPNACPVCGPHLQLWNKEGETIAEHHEALQRATDALKRGEILALKGLGGFQLLVDAHNSNSVNRLRQRKGREEKPFAVMVPTCEQVQGIGEVSNEELRLLKSPAAPIVLLRCKTDSPIFITPEVAPSNSCMGIMLPYTPLHHLLLHELGFSVVATSGNLSDEPICIEEHDALTRLRGIADIFLVHDRPIVRHIDDSVTRIIQGREVILRRARGYAPLPIIDSGVNSETSIPILAVGAHQKNTVALAKGGQIFISQHIGDLVTKQAFDAFSAATYDLPTLYDAKPEVIACDMHPDYLSTRRARQLGANVISVQHHHAHVVSCMAENDLDGTVLGVSWDGTGFGPDGTIWGGEFLLCDRSDFKRVAHLRQFPLPGGEPAAREPRRSALGLLYTIFGDALFNRLDTSDLRLLRAFNEKDKRVVRAMLAKNLNCPMTSSMGRLFDAVASIVDIRQCVHNEGQAAMELEFCADGVESEDVYPFCVTNPHATTAAAIDADAVPKPWIIDWAPMILAILEDVSRKTSIGLVARKFHNTLVEMIANITQHVADGFGEKRVVLSGGCFQNKLLTELAVSRFEKDGFEPYWHQRVPPNDGGIALGQAVVAKQCLSDRATHLHP